MNEFSKFLKLTKDAANLIEDAAGIVVDDGNTEEYLIEAGYYNFDSDNPIFTVIDFIEKYYFRAE